MKLAVLLSAIAAAVVLDGAETVRDQRPPLDKSDFRKTVWSQVNPWFPFNKQPVHDLGAELPRRLKVAVFIHSVCVRAALLFLRQADQMKLL